jgi:hypothetical protein
MGTGSFSRAKCGRGVLLTNHPLLAPRSWKSKAITSTHLWATTGLIMGLLYLYLKTHSVKWHDGLMNDSLASIWKWPSHTWGDLEEFIGRGWRESRWMSRIDPVTSRTQAGAPALDPVCSVLWSVEQAECLVLHKRSLNWTIFENSGRSAQLAHTASLTV